MMKMVELKISETNKNILLSAFTTPGITILINIIILLIFPLIEPFLSSIFFSVISPYIPSTEILDFSAIFLFIFTAIFLIILMIYSIAIGLNILGLLISYMIKSRLDINVVRIDSQKTIIKFLPIISLILTILILWLFMSFNILPIPESVFAFDISNFANYIIVASTELHFYVILIIIIAMIVNGGLKLIVDYSYLRYFGTLDAPLTRTSIKEYEER